MTDSYRVGGFDSHDTFAVFTGVCKTGVRTALPSFKTINHHARTRQLVNTIERECKRLQTPHQYLCVPLTHT